MKRKGATYIYISKKGSNQNGIIKIKQSKENLDK